ncbi:MAG: zinc-ribbon domain containing protein [Candidatus Improbicoccus pseudotrichonymphae]|uniref:Zinc-ribbon domain containing protein n=1 Tax=Candidatus Improbicoccus pseudotrichonymphae TaxID=3033792 RepID=A0AA48IGY9_9FIRM|nr:MAG: zinc-ribbon domain containing protein [Candidatus Improbicoccus pseudotrichonymphae]
MEYNDEELVCKSCGKAFVFTAGEQEFYAEKGFANKPNKCRECRDALKERERGERKMFKAVCAACGNEALVPFEPSDTRPVYCSDCFRKIRQENA